MISDMLGQSGLLTLLGMSVVFAFLIIMIIFMKLLHGIVHGLKLDREVTAKPKNVSAPAAKPVQVTPAPVASDQGAVIAAIAAVIHEKESN